MHVSELYNFVKVASVRFDDNNKSNWDIDWLKSDVDCSANTGRCYIIAVNDVVYKIGYSDCRGGLKRTFSTYKHGLYSKASDRTFGINLLIGLHIFLNSKVDIYISVTEDFYVDLKLIDGSVIKKCITVSGKELEVENLNIYFAKYNSLPKWNILETNNISWPQIFVLKRLNSFYSNRKVDFKELLKYDSVNILL